MVLKLFIMKNTFRKNVRMMLNLCLTVYIQYLRFFNFKQDVVATRGALARVYAELVVGTISATADLVTRF